MPDDQIGSYLKKKAYAESMAQDMQVVPARHGAATFVPSGSTIKIVNTSGTQVVDTWAFALPSPPKNSNKGEQNKQAEEGASSDKKEEKAEEKKEEAKPEEKKEESKQFHQQQEAAAAQGKSSDGTPKKGWSSYLPSIRGRGASTTGEDQEKQQKEKDSAAQTKENSKTWGQYFSAGKGFTNYIPSKGSLSSFASTHYRDPNKSYAEQLADFSKTPVGAAGISVISGSGYASSLYAGYSAWNAENAPEALPMEYLSMPHTRAATQHLIPRVNDVLVSNLREPMLTVVEDTSPGIHDTLIAACDPQRYRGLGVEQWEEHGSCAENLVMALKELNEKAGLKGAKGIGADVTVNAVPAPLNLFMNIPWKEGSGDLEFAAPKGKEGDFIRLRAERDVVIVMSACPQDVLEINAKEPKDAHFVVEEDSDDEDVKARLEKAEKQKKAAAKPRGTPKKLNAGGTNGTAKKPAAAAAKPAAAAKAPAAKPSPAASRKPSSTPSTKSTASKAPAVKPAPTAASKPAPAAAAASKPADAPATAKSSTDSAPAKAEKKPEAAAAAAPVERKKPKKLQRRGGTPQTTEAKSQAKTES